MCSCSSHSLTHQQNVLQYRLSHYYIPVQLNRLIKHRAGGGLLKVKWTPVLSLLHFISLASKSEAGADKNPFFFARPKGQGISKTVAMTLNAKKNKPRVNYNSTGEKIPEEKSEGNSYQGNTRKNIFNVYPVKARYFFARLTQETQNFQLPLETLYWL